MFGDPGTTPCKLQFIHIYTYNFLPLAISPFFSLRLYNSVDKNEISKSYLFCLLKRKWGNESQHERAFVRSIQL